MKQLTDESCNEHTNRVAGLDELLIPILRYIVRIHNGHG